MRETSSRSSTSRACTRVLLSIISIAAATSACSIPSDLSICTQPRMPVIGVRSSCASVARKSSFARLASCASRYSRAFCTATDAICASCVSTVSSSAVNAAFGFSASISRPAGSPSRSSSGAASSVRKSFEERRAAEFLQLLAGQLHRAVDLIRDRVEQLFRALIDGVTRVRSHRPTSPRSSAGRRSPSPSARSTRRRS